MATRAMRQHRIWRRGLDCPSKMPWTWRDDCTSCSVRELVRELTTSERQWQRTKSVESPVRPQCRAWPIWSHTLGSCRQEYSRETLPCASPHRRFLGFSSASSLSWCRTVSVAQHPGKRGCHRPPLWRDFAMMTMMPSPLFGWPSPGPRRL